MIYNYKSFKMKKLLFFLCSLCMTFIFGQNLASEHILTIKASTGDYSDPGKFLNLQTLYAPYTKGEVTGIFEGEVLPIGGDIPDYFEKEGVWYMELDIDMILLTEDNEKIYCKATGVLNLTLETFQAEKFQTHWRFRTSSKKYNFLNELMGLGFGKFLPEGSEYTLQHDIYKIIKKSS